MAKSVLNYATISDSADYEKKANNLQKRGANWAADFNSFVKASVLYFHGEGNHNPAIVNGLVSIAYATRGVNAGHLIDYIAKAVPHKVVKDKENKKRFLFTGKLKDAEYDAVAAELFLLENPVWSEWDGGASKTPKSLTIEAAESKVAAMMLDFEKQGKVVDWAEVVAHAQAKAAAKKAKAA